MNLKNLTDILRFLTSFLAQVQTVVNQLVALANQTSAIQNNSYVFGTDGATNGDAIVFGTVTIGVNSLNGGSGWKIINAKASGNDILFTTPYSAVPSIVSTGVVGTITNVKTTGFTLIGSTGDSYSFIAIGRK